MPTRNPEDQVVGHFEVRPQHRLNFTPLPQGQACTEAVGSSNSMKAMSPDGKASDAKPVIPTDDYG